MHRVPWSRMTAKCLQRQSILQRNNVSNQGRHRSIASGDTGFCVMDNIASHDMHRKMLEARRIGFSSGSCTLTKTWCRSLHSSSLLHGSVIMLKGHIWSEFPAHRLNWFHTWE